MKIIQADLLRIPLTMKEPFTISSRSFQQKDALLVRLHADDGVVGYGESGALPSPFYSPEYIDTAQMVLRDFILPDVVGRSFDDVSDLEKTYDWIKGHHFAKIAVEAAYWHLMSLQRNVPLYEVWGGTLPAVEVGNSLSIESRISTLLRKVGEALDQGFRRIKIKVKPGYDIKPVAAIRERFGDVRLMVDANSGYTLAPEHVHIMKELDQFDLMMIEQPLAHDDIIDHVELQRQLRTPICLDESIHSFEDARKAIDIGACRIINIKPPRVGGFSISKQMAEYARAHDIGVWCGGMFETGIGKAFNAHLCALEAFNLPADNSGSRSYYYDDLLARGNPIEMDSTAHIRLPTVPGLGWEIDEDYIQRNALAETFRPQGSAIAASKATASAGKRKPALKGDATAKAALSKR